MVVVTPASWSEIEDGKETCLQLCVKARAPLLTSLAVHWVRPHEVDLGFRSATGVVLVRNGPEIPARLKRSEKGFLIFANT
jgi:hypothetical protein